MKALATAFNQMAEELDRARDAERAFLLSVSHELKTPLSAIRGHGEALRDGVIEPDKVAAVVIAESERLERLVRDLLDLARLNQQRLRRQPASPSTWPSSRARRRHGTRREARRVGVSLGADVNGAAPATADPDRVLQVLANLIENAVRSTPAGGSVTVDGAGRARCASPTPAPGIPPDDCRARLRPLLPPRPLRGEQEGRHRASGSRS